MEQKDDNVMRVALSTKDGRTLCLPLSPKIMEEVVRIQNENPDNYDEGVEGVLMALNEIKKHNCE